MACQATKKRLGTKKLHGRYPSSQGTCNSTVVILSLLVHVAWAGCPAISMEMTVKRPPQAFASELRLGRQLSRVGTITSQSHHVAQVSNLCLSWHHFHSQTLHFAVRRMAAFKGLKPGMWSEKSRLHTPVHMGSGPVGEVLADQKEAQVEAQH